MSSTMAMVVYICSCASKVMFWRLDCGNRSRAWRQSGFVAGTIQSFISGRHCEESDDARAAKAWCGAFLATD